MIETIAVGTDGSSTAGKAVDAALDLAERYGATVVFLSAYSSPARRTAGTHLVGGPATDAQWEASEATAVERLLADAEEIATARGIPCRSEWSEGEPARVLVELAARAGADVLVIGNKGMHRRVLGSVPNTITHTAACSVFVVKTT